LRSRLLWKLFVINLLVIVFVIVVVWISVDYLAADYFVKLMEKYHISPEPAHEMFVGAVHRYLVWASLAAVLLAALLSLVLMRRTLMPLTRMTQITREIAAGNYGVATEVRSRDEIGQLAEAFNHMAASLQRIEKLRKQLMIDVAHELRTPLTNVRGYLEGLLDGVVAPSRENFELLHEETLRLAQLVEDILQLARADSARSDLHRESFSMVQAIKRQVEPFRRQFEVKQITATIRGSESVQVWADPEKTSRVLKNLVQNALQYTPPGGEMAAEVQDTSDQVRVAFTNTNRETRQEDLPFIFERFYRGEKSRSRDHGGAGIGLAIVKELVEAHGGRTGAELIDQRICIWFTLPAASDSRA
jgi:two-component system sensor histidine kinase BaeS